MIDKAQTVPKQFIFK